jgi:hypothetical protein
MRLYGGGLCASYEALYAPLYIHPLYQAAKSLDPVVGSQLPGRQLWTPLP